MLGQFLDFGDNPNTEYVLIFVGCGGGESMHKYRFFTLSVPETVQISSVGILGSMALGSQLRSQWSCVGHIL